MSTITKLFITLVFVQIMHLGLSAQSVADSTMEKVKQERSFYETLGKSYPADSSISVTETAISGVKAFWFNQSRLSQKHIIIYLHGGVYVLGSINTYRAMVSHLAKALNSPIIFVEYSLAPEHPFPAANNEILKVYSELKKRYPGYTFTIIGDSAGGGLAITLVYNCIQSKIELPNSLALISPWINLKCDNNSYVTKQALDPILSKDFLYSHALLYAPNKIKQADPRELKFKAFPPVFLLVGSDEVLNDDSKNFYAYIKPLQGKSKFKEYKDQKHVWPVSAIHSKESQEAMKDIREFLHLK